MLHDWGVSIAQLPRDWLGARGARLGPRWRDRPEVGRALLVLGFDPEEVGC